MNDTQQDETRRPAERPTPVGQPQPQPLPGTAPQPGAEALEATVVDTGEDVTLMPVQRSGGGADNLVPAPAAATTSE